MLKYYKTYEGDTRPQLSEAIERLVVRYRDKKNTGSISIPPRVGKSTVIRGAATEIVKGLGAEFSLILVPWVNLAEQIFDEGSVEEESLRYDLQCGKVSSSRITLVKDDLFYTNREPDWEPYVMCSMTMSLGEKISKPVMIGGIEEKGAIIDAVSKSFEKTGWRIPVFADESHIMKRSKAYGDFLEELVKANAFVVVLTGTPWTSDGSKLFGFTWVPNESEEAQKTRISNIREDENGDRFATFTTSTYENQKGRWVADYEISYRTAFKEMKAMNEVSAVWIDPVIKNLSNNESKKLSTVDFTSKNTTYSLRDVLKQSAVTEQASKELVLNLLHWRRETGERITGLVVTGSDEPKSDDYNKHARDVKSSIESKLQTHGENMVVEIATSVDDKGDPDSSSAKKIRLFREGRGADILIVKMMGQVGLDAKHLKVMAYLGPMRNGPLISQALTRVCTTWDKINKPSTIIMPEDKRMKEVFNGLMGDGIKQSQSFNEEVIKVEEKKLREEEAVRDLIKAEEGSLASGDLDKDYYQLGNQKYSQTEVLFYIRYICPDLSPLTDPKLLRMYDEGHIIIKDEEIEKARKETSSSVSKPGFVFVNEDRLIKEMRNDFSTEANSFAGKVLRKLGETVPFKDVVGPIQGRAKKKAGITTPLPECRSTKLLRRAIEAIPEAAQEVYSEFKATQDYEA